jgi:hypothetical protein
MIPVNPPSPPQQVKGEYACQGFAGHAGPDVARPAYGMIAGADIQGYFNGPYFAPSSVMLHGQPTKDW